MKLSKSILLIGLVAIMAVRQPMAQAQDAAPESWIVFEADVADFTGHNPNIYLMNATTGEITALTENLVDGRFIRNTDPAFSPDGNQIAFVSDRAWDGIGTPNTEIYVMNRDGGHQTRVTANERYDISPAWLDNEHLVFTAGVNPGELMVLDLTNGNETPLGVEGYSPDVNADGTQIAYVFEGRLHVMRVDGSESRVVVEGVAGIAGPLWSPDGSEILFTTLDDTAYGVYIVGADGENLRQISRERSLSAAWSPDGTQIATIMIGGVPEGLLHPTIDLYVMQADGREAALMAALPGWNANLDWH